MNMLKELLFLEIQNPTNNITVHNYCRHSLFQSLVVEKLKQYSVLLNLHSVQQTQIQYLSDCNYSRHDAEQP